VVSKSSAIEASDTPATASTVAPTGSIKGPTIQKGGLPP